MDQTAEIFIEGVASVDPDLRRMALGNLPSLIDSLDKAARADFIVQNLVSSAFKDVRAATLQQFAETLAPLLPSKSRVTIITEFLNSDLRSQVILSRAALIACVDTADRRHIKSIIPTIQQASQQAKQQRRDRGISP